ncbi:hypothetical protein L207DRAFT_528267 [Hyaloscypha variabilis F]|uniref:DUF7143 domain-containing protein n=1 Tax=Hyaloscypha variabilis (strain UAMH 11265 / GT02V1 / F) TaxID=1149755 RepID=A0A2J6RT19_HYAVF|nr:hypothetical protein L207DRAFT_528267 [Hyaloscypha variabilis F]
MYPTPTPSKARKLSGSLKRMLFPAIVVVFAPLNKGTSAKRADACFIVGTITLPTEVSDTAIAIQNNVACNLAKTTIGKAPDVTSGGITFSSIDFSQSSLTPLNFALTTFATADPLASSDLDAFTNQLNTYLATEVALRSTGGSLAIKDPKFFLAFQIARIKTAQGVTITNTGQKVQHLLGKVINNAGSEDQATKDKVTALSTVLS